MLFSFLSVYPYFLMNLLFNFLKNHITILKVSFIVMFIIICILINFIRDNYYSLGDYLNYIITNLSNYKIFYGASRCVEATRLLPGDLKYLCSMHTVSWWFGGVVFLLHSVYFANIFVIKISKVINYKFISIISIIFMYVAILVIIGGYYSPTNKIFLKYYFILISSYMGVVAITAAVFIAEWMIFTVIVLVGMFLNEPNKDSRRM